MVAAQRRQDWHAVIACPIQQKRVQLPGKLLLQQYEPRSVVRRTRRCFHAAQHRRPKVRAFDLKRTSELAHVVQRDKRGYADVQFCPVPRW